MTDTTPTVTVTAPEELAYPDASGFGEALVGLCPGGELIIDLRDVRFIDSCGLRLLLTERKRRLQAGGTIAVVNPSGVVQRLFELTGLADTLLRTA